MNIFISKEVQPIAVRMFPLKTERSSSGLIEFPSVSEAVIAIMKCNHIPVENKGTHTDNIISNFNSFNSSIIFLNKQLNTQLI